MGTYRGYFFQSFQSKESVRIICFWQRLTGRQGKGKTSKWKSLGVSDWSLLTEGRSRAYHVIGFRSLLCFLWLWLNLKQGWIQVGWLLLPKIWPFWANCCRSCDLISWSSCCRGCGSKIYCHLVWLLSNCIQPLRNLTDNLFFGMDR